MVCFAIPNAMGFWLWSRRSKLRVLPAVQGLLLVMLGASAITLWACQHFGFLERIPMGGLTPATVWVVLLIYPAVMLQLYFIDRRR